MLATAHDRTTFIGSYDPAYGAWETVDVQRCLYGDVCRGVRSSTNGSTELTTLVILGQISSELIEQLS